MVSKKRITPELSKELRALVNLSVGILGQVILRELGSPSFNLIEQLRKEMLPLRGASSTTVHSILSQQQVALSKLKSPDLHNIAHAFTLMLELINACENAYRSYRLQVRPKDSFHHEKGTIVYVLTAHPTEARSSENIEIFHEIQGLLIELLQIGITSPNLDWNIQKLRSSLEIAWKIPVAPHRRPQVRDEANHIYSIALREKTIAALLSATREFGEIYLRSWVGGDKDGHPGVDEKTLLSSLELSRARLLRFTLSGLATVDHSLRLTHSHTLLSQIKDMQAQIKRLKRISKGDGTRISRFQKTLKLLCETYQKEFGVLHPALENLRLLLKVFPALVIPMELRENSDLIRSAAQRDPSKSIAQGPRGAIERMLRHLALVSAGASARYYVRGLVISMSSSLEDVLAGVTLVERFLRSPQGKKSAAPIPVIPLFEQSDALLNSANIVDKILKNKKIARALKESWSGYFEIMLGYSDSAKEAGALASKVAIRHAVLALDELFLRHNSRRPASDQLRLVFFHGSGGSNDRGGGSIEEQTAWWPASALRTYKATIQGEMVERSFASPEITRRRLEHISRQRSRLKTTRPSRANLKTLQLFAAIVESEYRKKVSAPDFLSVVQQGTTYSYLHALKLGSRPSKRGPVLAVSGLRAIPWVLCWTQTRVLFPTWWGIGSAWRQIKSSRDQSKWLKGLQQLSTQDPLFSSFLKTLASTLARVELGVWQVILQQSELSPELQRQTIAEFELEFKMAKEFVRKLSGHKALLHFKPWLGSSIELRSPMIHPLNLIQILAIQRGDAALLRETVSGIACGMLSTG